MNLLLTRSSRRVSPAAAYDTDAQLYFDAVLAAAGTDTLSSGDKTAVNTFVLAAKSHNYWTKFKRINVFGGSVGTSAQQLLGALVPLYTGGGALTSDTNHNFAPGDYTVGVGFQGNGSSTYIDPGLSSTDFTLNDTHVAFYDRGSSCFVDVAGGNSGPSDMTVRIVFNSTLDSAQYDTSGGYVSGSISGPYGLVMGTRTSSSYHAVYQNGNLINSNATASGAGLGTVAYYVMAFSNNGTPQYQTANAFGSYSFGAGMSPTDAANYYTDLQAYMTAAGRNV